MSPFYLMLLPLLTLLFGRKLLRVWAAYRIKDTSRFRAELFFLLLMLVVFVGMVAVIEFS